MLKVEVLRCAQDFACGLGRPHDGLSAYPTHATNPKLRNFRTHYQGYATALIGGDSHTGEGKFSLRCVVNDGAVATFGLATIESAVGGGQ